MRNNESSNNSKNHKEECPFRNNLKQVLKDRNLSQKVAAEIAGISESTLCDWLAGTRPINYQAVLRLAKGLGCSFQWLLTGESEVQDYDIMELFDEDENSKLHGFWKIEAKKLIKREKK